MTLHYGTLQVALRPALWAALARARGAPDDDGPAAVTIHHHHHVSGGRTDRRALP